jgi:hypothetical protein
MNKRMVQPEHIKPGLDALLRKLEAKRNAWKTEQEQDRWIIERAAEMNDWFLEVFGDEQNRKHG